MIKDIIVCGTSDNRLRERLLPEHDLTLVKAVEIGHAAEETSKHAKELEKAANLSTANVSNVKNKSKSKPEKKKSVNMDNNLTLKRLGGRGEGAESAHKLALPSAVLKR